MAPSGKVSRMKSLSRIRVIKVLLAIMLSASMYLPALAREGASPLHMISVETSKGKRAWLVELASDNESRSKGLMFRKEMASNAGMLFRFDRVEPVSMWMKNTFLPLDMVFMGSDGRIKSIHYGAVPHSLEIISSKGPVRYVLEINAGEANRAGLLEGQIMRHPWFSATE